MLTNSYFKCNPVSPYCMLLLYSKLPQHWFPKIFRSKVILFRLAEWFAYHVLANFDFYVAGDLDFATDPTTTKVYIPDDFPIIWKLDWSLDSPGKHTSCTFWVSSNEMFQHISNLASNSCSATVLDWLSRNIITSLILYVSIFNSYNNLC